MAPKADKEPKEKKSAAPKQAAEPKAGKAPKAKKEKDPNAPKRPLTAYFCYSNSVRAAHKEANPGSKVGDIAKLVGADWKEMSEEEKQPFKDQAAKLKEEYLIVKAKYDAEHPELAKAAKPAKGKGKGKKKAEEEEEEEAEEEEAAEEEDDE